MATAPVTAGPVAPWQPSPESSDVFVFEGASYHDVLRFDIFSDGGRCKEKSGSVDEFVKIVGAEKLRQYNGGARKTKDAVTWSWEELKQWGGLRPEMIRVPANICELSTSSITISDADIPEIAEPVYWLFYGAGAFGFPGPYYNLTRTSDSVLDSSLMSFPPRTFAKIIKEVVILAEAKNDMRVLLRADIAARRVLGPTELSDYIQNVIQKLKADSPCMLEDTGQAAAGFVHCTLEDIAVDHAAAGIAMPSFMIDLVSFRPIAIAGIYIKFAENKKSLPCLQFAASISKELPRQLTELAIIASKNGWTTQASELINEAVDSLAHGKKENLVCSPWDRLDGGLISYVASAVESSSIDKSNKLSLFRKLSLLTRRVDKVIDKAEAYFGIGLAMFKAGFVKQGKSMIRHSLSLSEHIWDFESRRSFLSTSANKMDAAGLKIEATWARQLDKKVEELLKIDDLTEEEIRHMSPVRRRAIVYSTAYAYLALLERSDEERERVRDITLGPLGAWGGSLNIDNTGLPFDLEKRRRALEALGSAYSTKSYQLPEQTRYSERQTCKWIIETIGPRAIPTLEKMRDSRNDKRINYLIDVAKGKFKKASREYK